jgi:hypothetical protein
MTTRRRFGLAIALALAAASAGAAASQLFARPLADADIRKLIPLLAIDADIHDRALRDAERTAAADAARGRARQAVLARISSGSLDPLDWLRAQSPHAVAPSTGRYEAACSREWSAAQGDVGAVFTFGVQAPASWLAVAGRPASRGAGAGRATRPRGLGPESIAQAARAFYANKGFEPQGERAAFQWPFLSPDGLVVASVYGLDPATGSPACAQLASGPTIVLAPAPKAFGAEQAAPAGRGPAPGTLEDAVKEAGLADAEYQRLKFQVTMARRDARQPRAAAGQEQRPAAEQAVRAQDVETYRRFARELDPLLDRLER